MGSKRKRVASACDGDDSGESQEEIKEGDEIPVG